MAKAGGTTSANTNVQVLGADMTRQSISIHNLEHNNHILFLEFDAPASTVLTDGSFAITGPELILHVKDWPEIRGTVNLKSTSDVDYIVRTA